jgi:trigger factor
MKKIKTKLSLILIVALILTVFIGCSDSKKSADTSESPETTSGTSSEGDSKDASGNFSEFNYSDGIDENGFWKDVKALDNVELCIYEGISIPNDIQDISDQEIQLNINDILAYFASVNHITDRAVKDGDTVNIDYVGSIDGVEFEMGSTNGLGTDVTIGVTKYINDFLEQLIGHTPGETFNVEVTFPNDYGREELNGKDAVFSVTINHIVETIVPELTDDFVKENLSQEYGWNTVKEMKDEIESDLRSSAIYYYVQQYIVENSTVKSIPDSILKYQQNSMIQYYKNYADAYGIDFNEFLSASMGVSNTDELIEMFHDDNEKAAAFYLVTQAIAEDSGISVTNDDVAAYFKEMGMDDTSELQKTYGMPYLKLITLNQKVMDYIEDKVIME